MSLLIGHGATLMQERWELWSSTLLSSSQDVPSSLPPPRCVRMFIPLNFEKRDKLRFGDTAHTHRARVHYACPFAVGQAVAQGSKNFIQCCHRRAIT
jgi:hypothetical protein